MQSSYTPSNNPKNIKTNLNGFIHYIARSTGGSKHGGVVAYVLFLIGLHYIAVVSLASSRGPGHTVTVTSTIAVGELEMVALLKCTR